MRMAVRGAAAITTVETAAAIMTAETVAVTAVVIMTVTDPGGVITIMNAVPAPMITEGETIRQTSVPDRVPETVRIRPAVNSEGLRVFGILPPYPTRRKQVS